MGALVDMHRENTALQIIFLFYRKDVLKQSCKCVRAPALLKSLLQIVVPAVLFIVLVLQQLPNIYL